MKQENKNQLPVVSNALHPFSFQPSLLASFVTRPGNHDQDGKLLYVFYDTK